MLAKTCTNTDSGSTALGREPGLHEQLQALQALFTSFMEVIISQMAG